MATIITGVIKFYNREKELKLLERVNKGRNSK